MRVRLGLKSNLIGGKKQTMKRGYILLAEGFELIEALTPLDVLRRGGIDVKLVSISKDLKVKSSNNVEIISDIIYDFSIVSQGDFLILPGGYPGYENLNNSPLIPEILDYYNKNKKIIAAICGAPLVLFEKGMLENILFTCHRAILHDVDVTHFVNKKAVTCENIVTSQGAGTSLEFSFEILKQLLSNEQIIKLKKGMELD